MNPDLLKSLNSVLRGQLNRTRRRKNRSPLVMAGLALAIGAVSYVLHEPKAPPGSTPRGAELKCTVKSVYDGDTLTARCPTGEVKVRMFGIDAPEIGQKPWGTEAREALKALLPDHGIRLRVMDQDRYGRTVAQTWVDDWDAGLEMVRQGQAVMYEQYNQLPAYRQAQDEAKQARRGIWKKSGSQQDPAAWRRLNPR